MNFKFQLVMWFMTDWNLQVFVWCLSFPGRQMSGRYKPTLLRNPIKHNIGWHLKWVFFVRNTATFLNLFPPFTCNKRRENNLQNVGYGITDSRNVFVKMGGALIAEILTDIVWAGIELQAHIKIYPVVHTQNTYNIKSGGIINIFDCRCHRSCVCPCLYPW